MEAIDTYLFSESDQIQSLFLPHTDFRLAYVI